MSNENPFELSFLENNNSTQQDDIARTPCEYKSIIGYFGAGDERHRQRSSDYGGHGGIDLANDKGTPIFPILSGKVLNVGQSQISGNFVTIIHNDYGLKSFYAHLDSTSVSNGQDVNKNTQIGTMGNTGNAIGTSPHLHLEITNLKTNRKEDPRNFFDKKVNKIPAREARINYLSFLKLSFRDDMK